MSEEPPSPSVEITVIVEDPAWAEVPEPCADLAHRAAKAAVGHLRGRGANATATTASEVSVVLSGDILVRRLNRDYRGRDEPTNVLSFAGLDGPAGGDLDAPRLLGDVILARETIVKEAREQGKSLSDHLAHLVVHGVLHLFGHDHQARDEAEVMEALERDILEGLGIGDPYLEGSGADSAASMI